MRSTAARHLDVFAEIIADLEAGVRVSDTQFDKAFLPEHRRQAAVHWTPVAIAIEAAKFLAASELGPVKVLDVGANVGKFCVVGALTCPHGQFTGIEQRRSLVDAARLAARTLRIPRVRYHWGDMSDFDWSSFDGVYLFNPFYEHVNPKIHFDEEVRFDPSLFDRYVDTAREKLLTLRIGARVVTYHGFGGALPAGFIEHDWLTGSEAELKFFSRER